METIVKNNEIIKESKRGKNPKSLANLKKGEWKKGQSGNVKGKGIGTKNYDTLYKEALIKLGLENGKDPNDIEMEMIAHAIVEARKDYRYYKDTMDRKHGTPIQRTETKGDFKVSAIIEMQKGFKQWSKK